MILKCDKKHSGLSEVRAEIIEKEIVSFLFFFLGVEEEKDFRSSYPFCLKKLIAAN